MLVHKDLQGDAGQPEQTALNGMLAVGNAFMTDRRDGSEVQRAGEFVTMRREGGQFARLVGLWEPPDARRAEGSSMAPVPDTAMPPQPGDDDYVMRAQAFTASVDQQQGELPFVAVPVVQTRLPRYTRVEGRVEIADHATKNGKRRLWSLGDGSVLLLRELALPGDDRWFGGVNAAGIPSRRVQRVGRVQLLQVDPERLGAGRLLLEFDVHSGLGFDPGARAMDYFSDSDALFDASYVYPGNAGFLFGRTLLGLRADCSSTYAVAEPARAEEGGRQFLSLVAVHGLAEDAHDARSSALHRLTCTRTTPDGVVRSKIAMPPAEAEGSYLAPVEMDLVRLSPNTLVLLVRLASQRQPGAVGVVDSAGVGWRYLWSEDNGANWVHVPATGITDGNLVPVFGTVVPKDRDTLLIVSGYQQDSLVPAPDADSVQVYALTRAGASRISTIPGSAFSAGLHAGTVIGGRRRYPPYIPVAYGGGVRRGKDQLLWIQFDPQFIHRAGTAGVLDYPGSRAMLMVSTDGGATWSRRFLPQPWPQRVGFVVALDQTTLAVPVYGQRLENPDTGGILPLAVKLHTSRDGGARWRATTFALRLPTWAWVDGQMLPGSDAYDIDDARTDFNRGELFPIVALRDDGERLAPINPGRPWMADARAKEPENG